MAFDDDVFAPMHDAMFDTFGYDATVQRGIDAALPVRIIVNRNQEQLGDYGRVVARVTTIDMLAAQWTPQDGDVIAWTDRWGAHSQKVERPLENDGFVAKAVLYG